MGLPLHLRLRYTLTVMAKHDEQPDKETALKRDQLVEEVRRLKARLIETRDIPDLASEALRRARARTEEYRGAYGVATDELARARALLIEAWRELKSLEFSAPAYSLYSETGETTPGERGACPTCGGLASHSPSCSLARVLDQLRDPRPRRYELEDAVDRAWFERTGEREGVRSRLAFLDVLFAELAKWGVVRED